MTAIPNGFPDPATAAGRLVAAGVSVIPIRLDGSKSPPEAWKDYQARLPDAGELARWFGPPRPFGLAALGGAVSGNLEILDFDEDGLFPEYAAAVEALAPGLIPRLTHHRSPKPGDHLFYRCPGMAIPGNTKLALKPGTAPSTGRPKPDTLIETRGTGGYVVLPGSPAACHPSGGRYVHASGPPLWDVAEVTPAERQILIDVARGFNRWAAQDHGERHAGAVGGDRPGDRFNRTAFWPDILTTHGWAAARTGPGGPVYWRRPDKDGPGWSATTGYCTNGDGQDLLYVFSANAHPFEPLRAYSRFAAHALLNYGGDFTAAARELAAREGRRAGGAAGGGRKARDDQAGKNSADSVDSVDPPEEWQEPIPLGEMANVLPFPLDVLPLPLAEVVCRIAEATNSPPDFAALYLLTLAGALAGNSRWLLLKPGWTVRPCLYSAAVGNPSTAKSPPLKMLLRPIFRQASQHAAAHAQAVEAYRTKLEQYEAAQKQKEDPGPRPVKPRMVRVAVNDFTVESLAPILLGNYRGVIAYQDELSRWLASMNQYKGGKGGDRQFFLSCWSGLDWAIDRKGSADRKGEHDGVYLNVPDPFLAVTGPLTPSKLLTLTPKEEDGDGFLERLVFAYPNAPAVRGWEERGVPEEALKPWADAAGQLAILPLSKGPDGEPAPVIVGIGGEGKAAWVRHFNDHVRELRAIQEDDPEFVSYWRKMDEVAGRLALILHLLANCCRPLPAPSVQPEAVDGAWALVAYFKAAFRRVAGELIRDPVAEKARRILGWVRREGLAEFKARDAIQALQSKRWFPDAEALGPPQQRLCANGYLRQVPTLRGSGRGRTPAPTYQVNPSFLRSM